MKVCAPCCTEGLWQMKSKKPGRVVSFKLRDCSSLFFCLCGWISLLRVTSQLAGIRTMQAFFQLEYRLIIRRKMNTEMESNTICFKSNVHVYPSPSKYLLGKPTPGPVKSVLHPKGRTPIAPSTCCNIKLVHKLSKFTAQLICILPLFSALIFDF